MEKEIWKDIPDYEGIYQVSNLGRVKSLARTRKAAFGSYCLVKERILKSGIDKDGYLQQSLCKNNKMKTFKVHRLVANCFINNPNSLIFNQINHIDGNKLNNKVENLEWCDITHNNREAVKIGLKGGKPYRPRVDSTPIKQCDKNGYFIKIYENLAQAVRISGISKTAISNCLNGRSKSSGGYIWVYDIKKTA